MSTHTTTIRRTAAALIGAAAAAYVFWNLTAISRWGPNGGARGHFDAPVGLLITFAAIALGVGWALAAIALAALRKHEQLTPDRDSRP